MSTNVGIEQSGKAGGDKSYARAATRELMQFKNQLDEEIAKASPTFGQYLNRYREMSVPINRMQIGQAMMDSKSGSAILDPVTGVQVLTPAQRKEKTRIMQSILRNDAQIRVLAEPWLATLEYMGKAPARSVLH